MFGARIVLFDSMQAATRGSTDGGFWDGVESEPRNSDRPISKAVPLDCFPFVQFWPFPCSWCVIVLLLACVASGSLTVKKGPDAKAKAGDRFRFRLIALCFHCHV